VPQCRYTPQRSFHSEINWAAHAADNVMHEQQARTSLSLTWVEGS